MAARESRVWSATDPASGADGAAAVAAANGDPGQVNGNGGNRVEGPAPNGDGAGGNGDAGGDGGMVSATAYTTKFAGSAAFSSMATATGGGGASVGRSDGDLSLGTQLGSIVCITREPLANDVSKAIR